MSKALRGFGQRFPLFHAPAVIVGFVDVLQTKDGAADRLDFLDFGLHPSCQHCDCSDELARIHGLGKMHLETAAQCLRPIF